MDGGPTDQPAQRRTDCATGLWQRKSRLARQPVWAVWHYAQRGRGAEEEEAGAWARLLARMLTWSFDYVFRTDYGGRDGGRDRPANDLLATEVHAHMARDSRIPKRRRSFKSRPAGRPAFHVRVVYLSSTSQGASEHCVRRNGASVEKNCVEKFCAKPKLIHYHKSRGAR